MSVRFSFGRMGAQNHTAIGHLLVTQMTTGITWPDTWLCPGEGVLIMQTQQNPDSLSSKLFFPRFSELTLTFAVKVRRQKNSAEPISGQMLTLMHSAFKHCSPCSYRVPSRTRSACSYVNTLHHRSAVALAREFRQSFILSTNTYYHAQYAITLSAL